VLHGDGDDPKAQDSWIVYYASSYRAWARPIFEMRTPVERIQAASDHQVCLSHHCANIYCLNVVGRGGVMWLHLRNHIVPQPRTAPYLAAATITI
jgi:hypothetical protein